MNIRIRDDKRIYIKMEDQKMETIEVFGQELEVVVNSLAHHHRFYVNEGAELLDENRKKMFHSVT